MQNFVVSSRRKVFLQMELYVKFKGGKLRRSFMETAGFIIIIGVLFSFGAWLWYYVSIKKE
jgi:hypothetical protein